MNKPSFWTFVNAARRARNVNFPLKWMQKDLRFALATAESVAQPLPVAAAANAAYVRAVAAGSGDLDFSAVVETCRPRG